MNIYMNDFNPLFQLSNNIKYNPDYYQLVESNNKNKHE